jgi:hypothetical protein
MSISLSPDLQKVGVAGAPVASAPRVLREEMSMARGQMIGSHFLDEALGLWVMWREQLGYTPDWSSFKPFEHPYLLPHIMLYEKVEDRFRCSIVGETAGTNMPVKLAGCFLDEAMPPKNLADITRRLTHALDTETPNFVEKTMAWQVGFDVNTYRALQLPFPGRNGKSSRVLSVMDFCVRET